MIEGSQAEGAIGPDIRPASDGPPEPVDQRRLPRPVRAAVERWRATAARPGRLVTVMMLDAAAIIMCFAVVSLNIADPFENSRLGSVLSLFVFSGVAVAMFLAVGLYRRSWRFLSVDDCVFLSSACAVGLGASWTMSIVLSQGIRDMGMRLLPFVVLHAALLIVAMAGMRVVRRAVRDFVRDRDDEDRETPRRHVILFGELDWARAMIRLIQADCGSRLRVVAVVTPEPGERHLQIPGVRMIGAPGSLMALVQRLRETGFDPQSIILRGDGARLPRSDFMRLVTTADRLDLTLAKARSPWDDGDVPQVRLEKLPLSDLLGRPEVKLEPAYVQRIIAGRRILVTGAGGTIGSELVRQLATFEPAEIVLLDHSEYQLYRIDMEAREAFPRVGFHVELCSIRQKSALRQAFRRHRPEIVFHAAALKHVPMVEANPSAGVHTNVIGTRNVADAVCEFGVRAMVQVSTDKAVNPVGLMGATKRLGELYCQALDLIGSCDPDSPRFMTVRFGNVLGSSGSLVPLFERQLAEGKPLTVTHPDITRFFMTVEEAVQLILQSSARALETQIERGTIFVLDMGEPIKIVDIARRMIRLAGLKPDIDVPIRFVGLRPGEKLFEELFDASEERTKSSIPGVFEARPCALPLAQLVDGFAQLERLIRSDDHHGIKKVTQRLIQASAQSKWARMLIELDRVADDAEGGTAAVPDPVRIGAMLASSEALAAKFDAGTLLRPQRQPGIR